MSLHSDLHLCSFKPISFDDEFAKMMEILLGDDSRDVNHPGGNPACYIFADVFFSPCFLSCSNSRSSLGLSSIQHPASRSVLIRWWRSCPTYLLFTLFTPASTRYRVPNPTLTSNDDVEFPHAKRDDRPDTFAQATTINNARNSMGNSILKHTLLIVSS